MPRSLSAAFALIALTSLSSCATRRPAPPAPPPPQPAPPAPALPQLAWEDAPLSAGDWSWRDQGSLSAATFAAAGSTLFIFRCERRGEIALVRPSARGGSLTFRTSSGDRGLPTLVEADGLTARLAASDPLLDQIVFSRGRFAVEAGETARLVLPAWPEPARVVEDCRG